MPAVLDHLFICTAAGAPQADRLRHWGLAEGTANRHPGQGTANRRFFFRNAMLELLWVENTAEAQSEQTRPTRLWERWSAAGRGASPFGIILRPETPSSEACPFPSWEYRPQGMPGFVLQIATGTSLEEPMWCYMQSGRAPAEAPEERRQILEHPAGLREITDVRLYCPALPENSLTHAMAAAKVIALDASPDHLLELQFDGRERGIEQDFRPYLPLVCRA